MTRLVLFYRDKNWEQRGYANHLWLNIYPEEKKYSKVVTMCKDVFRHNIVEVARKVDIDDMVTYLKSKHYEEGEVLNG